MNLNNERNTKMLEYDLDISEQEADVLAKYGLDVIKKDKVELVNYAINHMLKQLKLDIQKDNKILEKLITEAKSKENNTKTETPTKKCGRPRKEK